MHNKPFFSCLACYALKPTISALIQLLILNTFSVVNLAIARNCQKLPEIARLFKIARLAILKNVRNIVILADLVIRILLITPSSAWVETIFSSFSDIYTKRPINWQMKGSLNWLSFATHLRKIHFNSNNYWF